MAASSARREGAPRVAKSRMTASLTVGSAAGRARQAADEVAKVETRSSRNYGKPAAAADLGAGRIRETHEVAYGVLLADIEDIYESMRNATSKGRIGLGRPNVHAPYKPASNPR